MSRDKSMPVMLIDTREQTPLFFGADVLAQRETLHEGDYSFLGGVGRFVIERKNIADCFATIVSDRERFERELQRLASYEFAAILVEATILDVLAYDSPESTDITEAQRKSRPATVLHSLLSWHVTYGVSTLFVSKDRDVCARVVLRLAQKFAAKMASKTAGAA